jgi:hypothetical protein
MKTFLLNVKKPIELVSAILDKFVGDSYMSLEGDLSSVNISELEVLPEGEINTLKRQDTYAWPKIPDLVVFRLTQNNVDKLKSFLPRIGIKSRVLHIQVVHDGQLVFGSYDQFGREQTWVSIAVGEDFVRTLMQNGIIGIFEINKYDSPDE